MEEQSSIDELQGALEANKAVLSLIASGVPVEAIEVLLEQNNEALEELINKRKRNIQEKV